MRTIPRMSARRLRTTAALLLAAGFVVGGAVAVRIDTGTTSFLPSGDPQVAAMDQKARDFGGDPIVVLLRSERPRALLTDHDTLMGLLHLEGTLAGLPDVASVYGPATTLNQLAGAAQNLLIQIVGRRDGLRIAAEQKATAAGLSPAAVAAAGEQATQELTLRYAPLLVRGLPVGLPTLNNPAFAGAVIYGPDGQPRAQWRSVAPDADTVAVLVRPRQDLDQAGTERLVTGIRTAVAQAALPTAGVTISGVPAVTADLSGEIVREIPLVSALVAIVVLLRFLLVPVPGSRRRRLLPLAAAAVGGAATFATFGWLGHPLSFGAVALLPVLLGVGSSFPLCLSILRDRRPVLVVAAASAAAFASLALSPLPFVRDLGLALALGVGFTVAVAVALGRGAPDVTVAPIPATPVAARRWRARPAVLVLAVVIAGIGWASLPGLDVRADPQELASGLPALQDATAVEKVLGSSGEVGVVLRGPDTLSPTALAWSRQAETALVSGFGDRMRPVLGTPDLFAFLGDSPTPQQIDAALSLVPPYLSSAVVRPDRQARVLVFGLRLQDLGTQADMLDAARAALPPPPAGYSADLVGLPVAAGHSYRALLSDRYVVNLAGIAVAGLVLAAGLRRRADAVRALVAATVATGWGFALLRLVGLDLSPLTVGLGALVTVTGCEFVVLLSEAGRSRHPWLRRSVAFAALTSAAGYLALAVSSLELVREFGLVLGAAVALSYLAARMVVWCVPPTPSAAETRDPAPEPMKVNA